MREDYTERTIYFFQESQDRRSPYAQKKTFDLDRTASVTRDEEQITFAWEHLTVKTRASSGRSFFRKSEPRPSKVLVDNSK